MKWKLTSEAGLKNVEKEVLARVSPRLGKKNGAYLLGLSGNLGSGKTRFTQTLARALGIKDSVPSPTFVLARTYQTKKMPIRELVHIDAYRLGEEKEFSVLQLEKMFEWNGTLVVMEWPERAPKDVFFNGTLSFIARGGKREVSFVEHD